MYTVRQMTPAEMPLAVEWAAAEGWNPGLQDGDIFYQTDPQGFFIGELDGEPIGCISAVAYDDTFGFIGFYIVKPAYRAKGYGIQLWGAAMAYLGDRTVGLDGVVTQQDNYKKSGFELAHRNMRFQGIGCDKCPPTEDIMPITQKLTFEQLLGFDNRFFPVSRPGFLKAWVNQPGTVILGVVINGGVRGYGAIRPCREGYKIGPLFAESRQVAEALCRALRHQAEDDAPVFLDIPASNPDALALAQRSGMTLVFETARMYKGTPPALPLQHIFGITSFELG